MFSLYNNFDHLPSVSIFTSIFFLVVMVLPMIRTDSEGSKANAQFQKTLAVMALPHTISACRVNGRRNTLGLCNKTRARILKCVASCSWAFESIKNKKRHPRTTYIYELVDRRLWCVEKTTQNPRTLMQKRKLRQNCNAATLSYSTLSYSSYSTLSCSSSASLSYSSYSTLL